MRYLVAEAEKRKMYETNPTKAPVWAPEELQKIAKIRRDWILSGRRGTSPRFEEITVGDKLPRRVIGPHTLTTFASEWRGFPFTTWGAYKWVGPPWREGPMDQ